MRTWDEPSRLENFAGPVTPQDLLEAYPAALGPIVANYAVRGIEDVPEKQTLGKLATLGAKLFGRQPEPSEPTNRLPSSEEVIDGAFGATILDDWAFRGSAEVTQVRLTDVRQALSRRTSKYNGLFAPDISAIHISDPNASTEYQRDAFTECLAVQMRDPERRGLLMRNVTEYVARKSAQKLDELRQGPLVYDYIIQGGGATAENLVSTIQETDPDGTVLVIDNGAEDGSELGGQFMKYGSIPTFNMNSRVWPVNGALDVYGIPTHGGDLNSPGLHAAIRHQDFVATDLPTNIDQGQKTALNIAITDADILLGVRSTQAEYVFGKGQTIKLGGYDFPVISRNEVIAADGAGIPEQFIPGITKRLTPADYLRVFGTHKGGSHPAEQFAGKTLAFTGCGDTAKIAIKLALGQGPSEAYRGLSVNSMRPKKIIWIAQELGKLGTKKEYQAGVRAMYASLAPYLPVEPGREALIQPEAGRNDYTFLDTDPTGRLSLSIAFTGENNDSRFIEGIDYSIEATGLTPPVNNSSSSSGLRDGYQLVDRFGVPYSRRASSQDIVSAGPVVKLGVRSDAGVPENTAALWANAASVTMVGRTIALRGRERRRIKALKGVK